MTLLNWLVLLLACVGHVTLVRYLFNYTFLVHLSEGVWLGLVAATGLTALVGPALFFWFPGSVLLRNGGWGMVHPAWVVYVMTCATIAIVGAWVVVFRNLHAVPGAQLSNHTATVDTCQVLGHRPAGHGKRAWVARLPFNELFEVDFTEKELALPRLRPEWEGLSVLHLTDVHFHGTPEREFYEYVFERCARWGCDLAMMTGDVLDDPAMAEWLPGTFGRIHAPWGRYFILGNHDTRTDAGRTRGLVAAQGWTDVGSRWVVEDVKGKPLVIAGVERPWLGTYPRMDDVPDAFRLLLTHGPHVMGWAKRNRFDLVLAGHLHGGQIRVPVLGPVTGGKYHGGVFEEVGTVMHVGRGLGQLTPVRWGCRPEVTKIVLRRSVR